MGRNDTMFVNDIHWLFEKHLLHSLPVLQFKFLSFWLISFAFILDFAEATFLFVYWQKANWLFGRHLLLVLQFLFLFLFNCLFLFFIFLGLAFFFVYSKFSDLLTLLFWMYMWSVVTGIQERAESALRAHSSSVKGSKTQAEIPEDSVPKTGKLPAFIKEEVLVGIYNVCIVLSFNS